MNSINTLVLRIKVIPQTPLIGFVWEFGRERGHETNSVKSLVIDRKIVPLTPLPNPSPSLFWRVLVELKK